MVGRTKKDSPNCEQIKLKTTGKLKSAIGFVALVATRASQNIEPPFMSERSENEFN